MTTTISSDLCCGLLAADCSGSLHLNAHCVTRTPVDHNSLNLILFIVLRWIYTPCLKKFHPLLVSTMGGVYEGLGEAKPPPL